jgi:hypothetical protein
VLQRLLDIPKLAKDLAREILTSSPVEGPGRGGGGSTADGGAVNDIFYLARKLDKRLHPLPLPYDATLYDEAQVVRRLLPDKPGNDKSLEENLHPKELKLSEVKVKDRWTGKEIDLSVAATVAELKGTRFRDLARASSSCTVRYAFASFKEDPAEVIHYVTENTKKTAMGHIPGHLYRAVRRLMMCHERLLEHYQWGDCVAGEEASLDYLKRWKRLRVPTIPLREAEALRQAAADLEERVKEEITRISQKPHEAEGNRRRGAPPRYPKSLAMAIELQQNNPDMKGIKIYNECKKTYGEEEPLPKSCESFMRSVRNYLNKHST